MPPACGQEARSSDLNCAPSCTSFPGPCQKDVVDQTRASDIGSHCDQRSAGNLVERVQRIGIDYLEVVKADVAIGREFLATCCR